MVVAFAGSKAFKKTLLKVQRYVTVNLIGLLQQQFASVNRRLNMLLPGEP